MEGICFKEPLFIATIEGRKTQTRRIVNNSLLKPRYQVGETVYLKEPYVIDLNGSIIYKYGNNSGFAFQCPKWANKLFMPKKYARYFIEITAVRCERLQDISDGDCFKEGIENSVFEFSNGDSLDIYSIGSIVSETNLREAYAELIDEINGVGTWRSNPFVWVYDYKLIK